MAMKRAYSSPQAIEINVEAEKIIADSLKVFNKDDDKYIDTSGAGQLGKGYRNSWDDIWK